MIISNEIDIPTKYNMNMKYYTDLGYIDINGYFSVKVEHLLQNCKELVDVSCDYCGHRESIRFSKYKRSLKSVIKKYSCSNCKGEKIKESNLEKYGVTSVAKLKSSKDKSIETNLEKYGVKYHTQSKQTKDSIIKSNLEKYGVDNVMKLSDINEKIKNKNLENWGVDNVSKSLDIKEKKKKTLLENWGVDSPLKSQEIKDKVRETNKIKYGNEFFTKCEEFRKINYEIAKNPNYLNYMGNGVSVFKCDVGEYHDFQISKDVYSKRKSYNISLCTVCNPINENRSIKESDLYNFIKSLYSGEIIKTFRDSKKEIDIYLPDLKIGFEFNGLYWHSDFFKKNNFHIEKTKYFEKQGIKIIHIWEDDWDYKRDIIKSQISNWIGVSSHSIFARKCVIKEIDTPISKRFLDDNHIQGNDNSYLKIGLYHDLELVSIMTFNKSEGRKKMSDGGYNLSRFCNKINTHVIGGASKMLSYFIKRYTPKRIISYAERDWSTGNLYKRLGFTLSHETKEDYKYIIDKKRTHKSRFRKSNTGISESLIDIPRVWDCGKLKFEMVI